MAAITAVEKNALLQELSERFEIVRAETGCKASFDDLDRVFYLRDFVLQAGYVSPDLSRAVCSRVRDTIFSWTGQLHNWVMPNPSSMVAMSEGGIWSDGDKDAMIALMRSQMALIGRNSMAGLSGDRAAEGRFIDDALELMRVQRPAVIEYARRTQEYWERESSAPQKQKR